MKILSTLFLIFLSHIVWARFEIQTSSGYDTYSDGKSKNTFSNMSNHLFIGASLDLKQKLLIGNNISQVSIGLKTTNNDSFSVLEVGPKVLYYFDEDYLFYTAIAWNPYVKGDRKVAGAASETISGWGYVATFGASMKVNRNFAMGFSINYHAISITESVVNTTASDVSESYSTIMPMVNFTLRFR